MENERGGYSIIVLVHEQFPFHVDEGRQGEITVTYTEPETIRGKKDKNGFQKIFNKQPHLKTGHDDLKDYLNSDEDDTGIWGPMREIQSRRDQAAYLMQRTDGNIKSSELKNVNSPS